MHATTIGHVMEQMLRPHFAQVAAQQGDYGLVNAAKYFGQQGFDDPLKVGATADFLEEAGSPFSGVIRRVEAGTPEPWMQQLRSTWGPESEDWIGQRPAMAAWHELGPRDRLEELVPPEAYAQVYGRALRPDATLSDYSTYNELPSFLKRSHYTPETVEEYMRKHWAGMEPDASDYREWQRQIQLPRTIIPQALSVEL